MIYQGILIFYSIFPEIFHYISLPFTNGMSSDMLLSIDDIPIVNGEFISLQQAQGTPTLEWYDSGKSNTVVLYDPDASHLHWIQQDGRDIVSFKPPNPPAGERHHYIFEVFTSEEPVDIDNFPARTAFGIHDYDFGDSIGTFMYESGY